MNKYARIQKNYPKFVGYYVFTWVMNIFFIREEGLILSFVEMIILTGAVLHYRIFYKIPLNQVEEIQEHEKRLKVLIISINTNIILSYLVVFDWSEWRTLWLASIVYLMSSYFLIPFYKKYHV